MLIQVRHLSEYRYTSPVGLGVHRLFLVPQQRPYFRIEHQQVSIYPHPTDSNFRQDLAGNWYQQAWFSGETAELKIQTEWIFRLNSFNPFGFILDKSFEDSAWNSDFPLFNYQDLNSFLIPFLEKDPQIDFQEFIVPLVRESEGLVDFLVKLTQQIYQNWQHQIRHEQNIWPARDTFEKKTGSCRDLAHMQLEMLRSMGLAARFVSGYAFNPDMGEGHELHAWLEVYLPGAGWVGLDPSLGLLTDHRYIPLGMHADPNLTMPVQGDYFGTAQSSLQAEVKIKLIRP
ncbi:transglutaminase family protein [Algoriphagus vanfongensis]|uniref:transglutaminase family protein n=1 Tax=Algoriphagus vanfongensis TaxID=426371 RepID=UPI000400AC51|nr:transglutaminase family protein [Algoriphagus vanfongensis]